jgi:hypothetical protein
MGEIRIASAKIVNDYLASKGSHFLDKVQNVVVTAYAIGLDNLADHPLASLAFPQILQNKSKGFGISDIHVGQIYGKLMALRRKRLFYHNPGDLTVKPEFISHLNELPGCDHAILGIFHSHHVNRRWIPYQLYQILS